MSHYSIYKTQFVSAEHLVQALNDMGFNQVNVYDKPVQLEGWLGDQRKNRAEIVIPRHFISSASNDMGFKLNAEGSYEAIISDYDRGQRLDQHWLNKLTQRYAYHVAIDMLQQQDFQLIEEINNEDQTIHLSLRRMA